MHFKIVLVLWLCIYIIYQEVMKPNNEHGVPRPSGEPGHTAPKSKFQRPENVPAHIFTPRTYQVSGLVRLDACGSVLVLHSANNTTVECTAQHLLFVRRHIHLIWTVTIQNLVLHSESYTKFIYHVISMELELGIGTKPIWYVQQNADLPRELSILSHATKLSHNTTMLKSIRVASVKYSNRMSHLVILKIEYMLQSCKQWKMKPQ